MFLKWEPNKEHWDIYEKHSRGESFVLSVVDENDNYHPLDDRVLWWLYLADLYRFGKKSDYIREVENYNDFIAQRQQDDFEDEMRHTARGDFRQITPHIFTPPKWYGED